MLIKIFKSKVFKFLIGGGVTSAINLFLIFFLIDYVGLDTPILRNIANIISLEISLVCGFFIYRNLVWTGGNWNIKEVLLRQLPLYHVSAGFSVLARIFFIFPVLDFLKINYVINTLIGVLLSAVINYTISDRFVFKTYNKDKRVPEEVYYPEGLSPTLKNNSIVSKQDIDINSLELNLFSIVIPAHNEEGSITETIQSITEVLETEKINYEILVVNDNSQDCTEDILQNLSRQNNKIRYINNYYPNGFGFAVRCGLENFQGDAVAIVMADCSDSPQNIVDYYYKLQEGYDCVFGSRFVKGGKVIDYPAYKLIINRLANLFIQIIFGLKFNDITNAFKAYRKHVIHEMSPFISHHFNLTVELPLKAIVRNYSYDTIPITWSNRKSGISKLKLKEMGSRYLFVVLYIWLEKHLSMGDYKKKL
ncbi:glycosyltransferase [Pseudanabaena sp. FACHB-1998]|uniref:glycosyltransferase n=1 Tax=Pseudanabaena sp. FACHB-1998 TaxID=2692858 RepID=UPI0016818917|nr:glycosyltransferase [Pseudanabaena sp. FACHB-1998]MBD2178233.1 glycosyltransferase [Pseudanabaena sp. FACHB-1998]